MLGQRPRLAQSQKLIFIQHQILSTYICIKATVLKFKKWPRTSSVRPKFGIGYGIGAKKKILSRIFFFQILLIFS